MDIQALKISLIQKVIASNSQDVLEYIDSLFSDQSDWGQGLSKQERESIERGLAQAKNGDTISNEEMQKRINALLSD